MCPITASPGPSPPRCPTGAGTCPDSTPAPSSGTRISTVTRCRRLGIEGCPFWPLLGLAWEVALQVWYLASPGFVSG